MLKSDKYTKNVVNNYLFSQFQDMRFIIRNLKLEY